ncbi:MAG TPA: DUF4340 domain-containing protein [Flavobacteriales bacterium]|nr:DUF4340 domain-containing protein [Flavobacteriales bacterium]HIA10584.1 DUF4340 domain-containing protein [Flavobacteriales bacterium]HIO71691.1 DUF4340 domain-containing protein [Flavobacteriales bacterium]
MFKKLSNKNLLIIIALLGAIVLIINYLDSTKSNRTFREELVSIDSSAVTQILLYPKATQHEEVKLEKISDLWQVTLANGNKASVPIDRIQGLIMELQRIKPMRLAATKRSSWADFKTDSSGSRVKVMEGETTTLDIIVGRFDFNQQARSATSFVRLYDDSSVYAVDGFLELSFNQGHDSFRDKELIRTTASTIMQINFVYPDSAFSIVKNNDKWLLDDLELDSTAVATYLNTLANTSGNQFVDDADPSFTSSATYSLRVETMDAGTITIDAYIDSVSSIVNSSQNPESYFDGSVNNLVKSLFVGSAKFITSR